MTASERFKRWEESGWANYEVPNSAFLVEALDLLEKKEAGLIIELPVPIGEECWVVIDDKHTEESEEKEMTAEEEKKYLEDKVSNADLTSSYVGVNWREVYKTAIDATEKQVPKKPIKETKDYVVPYYFCSSCGVFITNDYEGKNYDHAFCSCCGQRIDWEEEKK